MLQDHDRKLLIFYDSGCIGSCSDLQQCLCESWTHNPKRCCCKAVRLEGSGDKQFLLYLADPGDRATITALQMPHVTTKFPVWPISEAWKRIQVKHKQLSTDNKPLPPPPITIRGDKVRIMIGIRYLQYFPIPIFPCLVVLIFTIIQIAVP